MHRPPDDDTMVVPPELVMPLTAPPPADIAMLEPAAPRLPRDTTVHEPPGPLLAPLTTVPPVPPTLTELETLCAETADAPRHSAAPTRRMCFMTASW
jgi:hypothetical protein